MRNRNPILFVLFVLVLAMTASACVPIASGDAKDAAPRTVNVNGSAQAVLTPDIAYITIGMHTENKDAKQAVDSNNVQAQKVMDALKAAGVAAEDMLTSNFSIFPQDEWGPDGNKVGTKFVVDNTVYVTLRDLDKVGDVLTAAVEAGANSVHGIQFDVADKTKVLADARMQAVENARFQAEELAKAAGVELGEVQSINYYNSYPAPLYDAKMANSAVGGGVPISAGQMTLTVDVSISFLIR